MDKTEGFVSVDGGRVWYRSLGTGGIPLLLLHGGPGAGHDYLEPLEALAADRQVVFYDQLGCGRSERPEDPALWRIDRFVAEIGQVRDALGLPHVHLLGHSWGGWLAIEYMLGQPSGVVSLVLASTSASMRQFVQEAARLKAQLPRETFEVLQRYEAVADFGNPEYQAAVMQFYERHLCRSSPWPDCLMRSVANLDGNPVYLTMNGPNEFTVVGTLREWDRCDRLQDIRVPALITVGRHDEVPLPCAETIHRGIPGSKLVVFDQSSHMAMLEQTDAFVQGVAAFLSQVELTITRVNV